MSALWFGFYFAIGAAIGSITLVLALAVTAFLCLLAIGLGDAIRKGVTGGF